MYSVCILQSSFGGGLANSLAIIINHYYSLTSWSE